MDPAKLIMISEQNQMTMLNLLECEEEFEETVDNFRLSYERRRRKRKLPRESPTQCSGSFWEQAVSTGSDKDFKQHFRIDKPIFNILVKRLQGLKKTDTDFEKTIPIEKRIAVALFTLGCTRDYSKCAELFGISTSNVSQILQHFCQEVKDVLSSEFLPSKFLTQLKIEVCVREFEAMGFPQCFGGVGVLENCFALVDYRGRFLYVDCNSSKSQNDAHNFEDSSLKKIIDSSSLFKKNSKNIEGVEVPVLLLGDASFPLSSTLMTPYTICDNSNVEQEKLFNETLEKTRNVVEQTFQQLKARFPRISMLEDNQQNKNDILLCCCILHNILTYNWHKVLKSGQNDFPKLENYIEKTKKFTDQQAENIRNAISRYLKHNYS